MCRHPVGHKQLWISLPMKQATPEPVTPVIPASFPNRENWQLFAMEEQINILWQGCFKRRTPPELTAIGKTKSDCGASYEIKLNSSSIRLLDPQVAEIQFSCGNVTIGFDRLTGNFATYEVVSNGTRATMFVQPMRFNFYRAPTDNDNGGGDMNAPVLAGIKQVGLMNLVYGGLAVALARQQGVFSYASLWKNSQLNRIESRLVSLQSGNSDSLNKPKCLESWKNQKDVLWVSIHQFHGPANRNNAIDAIFQARGRDQIRQQLVLHY